MFIVGMVVMKIKMAKKISEVQTSIDIFRVLWYINYIEKTLQNPSISIRLTQKPEWTCHTLFVRLVQ